MRQVAGSIGLEKGAPAAKRASALYHLGMKVVFDAKETPMRPDQEAALGIFVAAINHERRKVMLRAY